MTRVYRRFLRDKADDMHKSAMEQWLLGGFPQEEQDAARAHIVVFREVESVRFEEIQNFYAVLNHQQAGAMQQEESDAAEATETEEDQH